MDRSPVRVNRKLERRAGAAKRPATPGMYQRPAITAVAGVSATSTMGCPERWNHQQISCKC
jgi:hypothetical protein